MYLIILSEGPSVDLSADSKTRVYQIGVSDLTELSELSELLASTNNVLQRNSNLRASLTISAVKRSSSSVGTVTGTPRSVRKSTRQDKKHQMRTETSVGTKLHHNKVCLLSYPTISINDSNLKGFKVLLSRFVTYVYLKIKRCTIQNIAQFHIVILVWVFLV